MRFYSSAGHGGQAQAVDGLKNGAEQLSRHCHLRHLKDYPPAIAHHLGPDLDQLLPQRRQRPVPHRPGQDCLPQKVAQVVGQHWASFLAWRRRLACVSSRVRRLS